MKIRTTFSLLCLALMMLLSSVVYADPCATYRSDYDSKEAAYLSARSNLQRMKVATAKESPSGKVGPELKHLEDEYNADKQSFLKNLMDGMSVHPNLPTNSVAFFNSLLTTISQAEVMEAADYARDTYISAKSALKAAKKALEDCTGMSVDIVWCERGADCKTPPGVEDYPRAHFITDCPDEVEGAFNINVACPGTWWKCDGMNKCPRISDHVVACKGAPECDDMIGPDRLESYHQITCETNEAFTGCGQTYSICSKSERQAHSDGTDTCPLYNGNSNTENEFISPEPSVTAVVYVCGNASCELADASWVSSSALNGLP